jgi:hypothetical protein
MQYGKYSDIYPDPLQIRPGFWVSRQCAAHASGTARVVQPPVSSTHRQWPYGQSSPQPQSHPLNPRRPAGASAQFRANEFKFYPSGAHGGCQDGDCSFPGAWHKRNQTTYPVLGNAGATGVLKIAISDYFPKQPTLYFTPGAWCDMNGAIVGPDANGLKLRGARRRLSQAGPPELFVSGGDTCYMTGEDAVTYKVGNGPILPAERANGGAFKIMLPNNLPNVSGGGG